jgi:hypothetical protein
MMLHPKYLDEYKAMMKAERSKRVRLHLPAWLLGVSMRTGVAVFFVHDNPP